MKRRHILFLLLSLASAAGLSLSARAADGPYDESADARAQIRSALAQGGADGRPVLVVFGANWCGDCKVLDLSMKAGGGAAQVQSDFRIVKVDVGRFDRNVDIATDYGVPLKKGIPAVAVLAANGDVIFATRTGELADARRMGDAALGAFFTRIALQAKPGR